MSVPTTPDAKIGPAIAADASRQSRPTPQLRLSRDLIGMKVVSPKGEHLGRIEELVVHPGSEQAYVVLSFGGWLGVGDKFFAMPWSVFKPGHQGSSVEHNARSLVLPLDKERLKTAPGFDKAHWPHMANADWTRDINAFYAGQSGPRAGGPAATAQHAASITWKLADLKGVDVTTPDGTKLGDIKGLAIDSDGRVAYAALSVGGFLGVGDRSVAVPWDALRFGAADEKGGKRTVTLKSTKHELENAPLFKDEQEHASAMIESGWVERVHKHFGRAPYWTSAASSLESPPVHSA